MAAREENILNVPLSETLEGMHVLCDTGDTGEPYRVAASLFIAEATQAAKDAVANLDPKDVILKGFTALTAGKPAITANSTLLAAIQSLYAMAGSGKVKIVSDGADQTGMVCWNGTRASGFVINVNEAAIYTRSQWTQSNPDSVTDANWIAAVKTGGVKNPFNALNTLLTGWVNRATQKPTITSANTIFDALKALYWASGNGNVLNISNGENRFGFVGWNANTAYGFMVDTANFTIYIRQWAQAQATSNANTAALWREAIQGGEAFSLKQPLNIYIHPGTSSVPLADLATVKEADVFIYTVGDNRTSFLKSELYDNEVVFNSVTALTSEWSDQNNPPEVHFMSIKINLTTGDLTPDVVPVFLPSWLKIEGTPIQVSDFKTIIDLDKFKGMRDGELVGFFSSSGGGASGPGVNPVLGYIQRASASQANILAYNMGATKAWIGYATSAATKWTELGGGGNVLHGNDITEGLEYLVPENVGDVVAFRSTMDSAQVPAEQEGFGFLAKVNGSESMAMMMQNDPAGGGKMKFFMGRVQNDGTGTDWQELTTGSSGGTNGPKIVMQSEFTFDSSTIGTKKTMIFDEPIPLGSVVTFSGSYSYNPPGEEYLVLPPESGWSKMIVLPSSPGLYQMELKTMFGFYDPIDFTSGMFRQKSFIQVASTDVVDGKIKSLSCWASGDLLDDIYITVDMVVFEFLPN